MSTAAKVIIRVIAAPDVSRGVDEAAAPPTAGLPHSSQKRAPAARAWPQDSHLASRRGAPQLEQKRPEAGLAQRGQLVGVAVIAYR